MFDLKSYLNKKREIIDTKLSSYIEGDKLLKNAMHYSLMAGGKRLRPILCFAGAEVVGGDAKDCLEFASALEMIHTYSLIHDDLPEMDNDKLRRGKATCHIAFDHGTALLAGDGLLTLAFEVMSDSPNINEKNAVKYLKISSLISKAAGFNGMIEGQILDVESEGKILSLDELEKIHVLKTGEMICASVLSGAIMGEATNKELEDLKVYAQKIGLAFQVRDDILNVVGNPELMGKAVGTDAALNKATYPAIMGLEESKKFAGDLICDALTAIESFDDKAAPLRAIANYILDRKR
ncbi:MAG: polyprenyl synthetase family protein [Desulfobacterales bacterium]|nr:polyprenyl synthetase family protein [Desulfobacterales bacterium]MCP4163781.1 polyprenyl synthetase family protein [Deltaproteobacteria bacterium]